MFEFTGLRLLHQDMKQSKEKRAVFPFEYNGKKFSCIFIADTNPFRMYLTTLGLNPVVFELEVFRGYRVNNYLEGYRELISYLGLKYDPNHVFTPSDFFQALNKKIPAKFTGRPNYKEVLYAASKRRNIEEKNKIYFCGWHSNPPGKRVREENLEKTKSAFGDKKAQICKTRNISSCWTDVPEDENLTKLYEIEG